MPAGFYAPSSEIEPIVGIQICVFSPEEIERRSVVEITNAGTYEGNEPKIGGLFDPRMGVLDNGKECRSCGQTNHKCPGHFGHFRLARPVYYIQFFPFILNVLSCVCIRCSKLLIDKNFRKHFLKRKGEARWREVLTTSKEIKRCGQETEDGCGARQPTRYIREGIARIVAEWDSADALPSPDVISEKKTSDKQSQPLEVEFVLRLFRRILDEDVDFMGLSRYWCRPDWMICTVLPIPPPQVRPSVIQDNNQRSEDDLTHKLAEIIKTNNAYLQPRIQANAAKSVIDEWTNVLQYHIATLVDNQIPGVAPSAQRNGRPLKSIQQRLGSKEGRIRYNIQGKRVEFSARSVITPDPNISIAELGVPEKIAMNLTRPERVTEFNRDKLYKYIQNGPNVFPGAKTIRRGVDGRIISLRHVNSKDVVLHYGDIVNRHLMDGDIVLFNRQPTLHRMSMMAHRVKVLKYKTFRLNVSVTAPYNADFDGDEMNMHCPQSYEAATELEEIAAVPHQILRPRDGLPVIGVVQDTLVGSYRLTRPHVSFNRREFMNLMMWNKRFDGIVPESKAEGRWTGHQVLSQLMPPINMDMMNSSKKKVVIRNGDVLEGQFDKSVFSKASKGIIHMTYNDYGSKQTVDFLDAMQNTIEQFLVYNGFSVGISDLIADSVTKDEMNVKIQEKKSDVESILLSIHQDLFDNNTGKTNQAEFEDKIFGILNKATELSGEIGYNSLANENRMTAMVRAGSKGGPINIAQMIACVGQQNIEGKRIPYGFEDRTLPHFKKYDDGAEARGFIENSFINGLTPTEFFFHAMSGREGLIDTAVKTASTGYIQRRLVKAMEDLVVQHDGSVRDANMNIAQFHYGEDGINSTKIENQTLEFSKLSREDIKREFGLEGVDLSVALADGLDSGVVEAGQALKEYTEQVRADQKMVVEGVFRSGNQGAMYAAVNIDRLIMNLKVKFGLTDKVKTNLTPAKVLAGIEAVIEKTQRFHKMWAALLRYTMSPFKMIVKERFTESAFDTLCETLVAKNWQAWVQPGEQVGIIAAQSIGEPSTQMSASRDTFVQVVKNGGNFIGPVGEFIDKIIADNAEHVIKIGHDSVVLDLAEDCYIIGVSNDEKTSWKRISQVSRHPANGGLVKITTKSGRSTTATLTHSFLKRTEKGVEPILGSDLTLGMRVPIATKVDQVPMSLITTHSGFTLDKDFGWLCGIYLADGALNGNVVKISKIHPVVEASIRTLASKYGWKITTKDYLGEYGPSKDTNIHSKELRDFLNAEFKTGSYDKTIGPITYSAPKEFQQGLLSGYFDGDGNVNAERHQIRAGSRSQELIRHINRLLSYAGFFSVLGKEASIRISDKTFYTVNVLKKYAAEFKERIGFRLQEKADALDLIVDYMARTQKHDTKELYDKIPAVGRQIAAIGKALGLPGQSRNYGRWLKKESVGRQTLKNYIEIFEAETSEVDVSKDLAALKSAAFSDVIWDEITHLEYLADPKEFVYDFTVPGNDSFMVDDAILVHNTLNTFHLAGVASKSNVTRGVPRLEELLKVTQNPKATSLTIPLKKEYRNSKAKAREVSQELELTLLRDMTIKTAIYYDPKDSESILNEDRELLAFYRMFEQDADDNGWSKYILRLELNRQMMFDKNITMDDILFVLRRRFESEVKMVYSDFNSQKLVMRIRLSAESLSTSMDPALVLDHLASYKKFQNKLLNSVIIRGLPGIKAATFRKGSERLVYDENEGKYSSSEEYILDTDGSNFLEVMNHPAVDATRVTSTHVHDVYPLLGIEATRHTLYTEIVTLFEDGQINYRHLGLLVDVMTRAGRLMSVDRYGINKLDIGPLAKASFEETERILLKAAVFGEIDPVTGVSANIMAGQPIRGGTAFSDILLDEVALLRLQKGLPPVKDFRVGREAPVEEEDEQPTNDFCSPARLRMNLTLPTTKANLMDEPDIDFVELV